MLFLQKLAKFWNCLFKWNFSLPTESELMAADVIVTQAFSRLANGKAGPGNELLAQAARDLQKRFSLPILAQEEVSLAAPDLQCELVVKSSADGRSTIQVNTFTVAKAQAEFCARKGWKRVIVVVVPYGRGRALWVYERLGLKAVPAPVAEKGYEHPNLAHWTARGGRIRSFFAIVRELLCRLLFLYKGWM